MKSATTTTRQLRTQDALLARRVRNALSKHRQRAKAAGWALDYGQAELENLAARSKVCGYCGRPIGFELSFDHAVPTSRPGGNRFALANIIVCCSRCQSIKGQMDSEEVALLLALLKQLHPASRADVERRLLAGGIRYCRR